MSVLMLNSQQQVMLTASYQASGSEQDLHTTLLSRIGKDEIYGKHYIQTGRRLYDT